MKIIAIYLPQYHQIKENDEWWGEGYTEWSAVKASKPLSKKHYQPRIPINNNYYSLDDPTGEVLRWQSQLAKKHGIFGFSFYHYWFLGKKLLETPAEILLKNSDININFCFCWANETWTKTWYGLEKEILIEQQYGSEKDWETHFNYLLKFFKDPRYIKIENRPVIQIYQINDISCAKKMIDTWSKLAIKNGFDGVYLIAARNAKTLQSHTCNVDAYYNFEPGFSLINNKKIADFFLYYLPIGLKTTVNKYFKTKFLERKININFIYRKIMDEINKNIDSEVKIYPGIFPMWDNTPRRQYKGMVYEGETPKAFYELLSFINNVVGKDDFVFINAWNEWGEGCYLEPDTKYGYAFLEQISRVVNPSTNLLDQF